VRADRASIPFFDKGGYWIESDHNPEGAIAHEWEFLAAAFRDAGFRVENVIDGFWAGEFGNLAYQDLIFLRPSR